MAVLFKSDCIKFVTPGDCHKVITYSNSKDFSGLFFHEASPNPDFYILVRAVFEQEENPQEQEDIELSDGRVVTLRQTIQEKRLLETDYMPNYMHRKLQKILMLDTVSIDDTYWRKRDPYETRPVKKYNMKTGQVWLTKYDSVEKNTI